MHDATDADFDARVLARSREVPVLVDFWAAWCGPCRVLGPVLEQVAGEYEGRVEVVKVDTDANQGVASRYGIRSIPAVKLFVGGAVAGEFVGAIPAGQVRAFLEEHLPNPADDEAAQALARAQAAFAAGDLERAEAEAAAIGPRTKSHAAAETLRGVIAFARAAAGDDPDPRAEMYRRAAAHAGAGRWRDALDELVALVERDRRWNGEAARKAMLAIFAHLGVRSPTSDEYLKKLALLL